MLSKLEICAETIGTIRKDNIIRSRIVALFVIDQYVVWSLKKFIKIRGLGTVWL